MIPREVGNEFWSLETDTVRTVCHVTSHVPQECPIHLTVLIHLGIPTHTSHVRDRVVLSRNLISEAENNSVGRVLA